MECIDRSKKVAQWWGPFGVTNPICEMDVREGDDIKIEMLAGEQLGELSGSQWPMRGVIEKIVDSSVLIFTTFALKDEHGNPAFENRITVRFEDVGEKTKFTVQVIVTILR